MIDCLKGASLRAGQRRPGSRIRPSACGGLTDTDSRPEAMPSSAQWARAEGIASRKAPVVVKRTSTGPRLSARSWPVSLQGTCPSPRVPFPNRLVDTSTTRSTVGRGRSHPRPTAGEALTSTGAQAGGASRSFYGPSETPAFRGGKNRSGPRRPWGSRQRRPCGLPGDGFCHFPLSRPGARPTVPTVAEDFGMGELVVCLHNG